MLRLVLLLSAAITILSCSGEPYYEKDFYEKISRIKLPKSAKAIESIDNGEFVTTTVFVVDSLDLLKLIDFYRFDTTEKQFSLRLFGNSYLEENKLDDSKLNDLYYNAGSKNKNHWLYLVDLKSKRLWAEIVYPDWAGN